MIRGPEDTVNGVPREAPRKGRDPVECSIVVPVYNEADVLLTFYDRLADTLNRITLRAEIIFVNDGSHDDSPAILRRLLQRDPRVKIISLSRNFGHQAAITAGTDHSQGQAVIVLDADLQDPPELIPELIQKWREGFEVVYAVREKREGESRLKRLTAALFYRLFRRITDIGVPLDAGDYRLMGPEAVTALRSMRERHRFVRGMVSWVGFRQTGKKYVRGPRLVGTSKYPLRKMIALALDAITSFSFLPLKLASYLGFGSAGLSFVVLLWVLYIRAFDRGLVPGWASQMVAILFLGGVQLISLGILGEYIARIYDEVRGRPLYIVQEVLGIDEASTTPPMDRDTVARDETADLPGRGGWT